MHWYCYFYRMGFQKWWISGSCVNFTFCVCENVCEFYILVHIARLPSIEVVFIYISTILYKCRLSKLDVTSFKSFSHFERSNTLFWFKLSIIFSWAFFPTGLLANYRCAWLFFAKVGNYWEDSYRKCSRNVYSLNMKTQFETKVFTIPHVWFQCEKEVMVLP